MIKRISHGVQLGLFAFAVLALLYSLYAQYVLTFEPCPLCIMQRVSMCFLGVASFVGVFCCKKNRLLTLLALEVVLAAFGLFFALRQIWLESLPVENSGVCMPGLDLLIHYLPPREIMKLLFWGERSCGDVTWHGFGLSMATWSSMCFSVIILILLGLIYRIVLDKSTKL